MPWGRLNEVFSIYVGDNASQFTRQQIWLKRTMLHITGRLIGIWVNVVAHKEMPLCDEIGPDSVCSFIIDNFFRCTEHNYRVHKGWLDVQFYCRSNKRRPVAITCPCVSHINVKILQLYSYFVRDDILIQMLSPILAHLIRSSSQVQRQIIFALGWKYHDIKTH